MSGPPYARDGDAIRLNVRVTPRARKSGFTGLIEGADGRSAIAVKLAAPPVDGAANEALIAYLAAELGVARSVVRIVSGEKSRLKVVRISNLAASALQAWLTRLSPIEREVSSNILPP